MASILNATTTSGLVTSADNSGSLQLQTNNGTTAVTIDTSQNVGIGTTSPSDTSLFTRALDLNGTSGAAFYARTNGSSTNYTLYGNFGSDGYINNRAAGNFLFYNSNAERMRITSGGYTKMSNDGTYISSTGSYHEIKQTGTGNAVIIWNSSSSATTDGIVRIDATRNTTDNTFYALTYYNQGSGTYKFRVADSGNVTNTNGSYGTISDVKNKENIVNATPKLDKINQLQVRNFNFKGDDLKQIGFIAQEFEQVFPSMIEEHKDTDAEGNDLGTTTKSIKTSVLVPILVKAIQELKAELDATKAEVQALKGVA